NMALEIYEGTLLFVSLDREFVSSLANRILVITPNIVIDFTGNYEDYLRSLCFLYVCYSASIMMPYYFGVVFV
ncbi:hypothetical protein, partial [Pectobacterium brasiliense]|uniref:hypothetical protein n=1 Tax=Pectobacterium brasiliense TaxID=180957 RepID=UPI0019691275